MSLEISRRHHPSQAMREAHSDIAIPRCAANGLFLDPEWALILSIEHAGVLKTCPFSQRWGENLQKINPGKSGAS